MTVLTEFVDAFVAWAKARGEELSPQVAEVLLAARQRVGGGDLGDWHCHELAALLLEHYPRHVPTTSLIVRQTLPTAAALFDYLAETDQFSACSDSARRLRRTLLEVAGEFSAAMRDPARYGPAKSLVLAMRADEVEMSEARPVDGWLGEADGHASADQTGAPANAGASPRELAGLPRSLPAVRIRPRAELAEAARGSVLLAEAHALARWVGRSRPLTGTGVLRVADAKAAADELRLWTPGPDADGAAAEPRTARAIPGLMRRWTLGLDTHMIRRDRRRAWQDPELAGWPQVEDDVALAVWEDALESVVSAGLDFGEGQATTPEALEGMAAAVLTRLFLEREACPLVDLAEGLEWAAVDSHPFGAFQWEFWRERHGCPVRMVVDQLVLLGAARVGNGLVSLSPLGVWAVRRQLIDLGVEVPERAPLERRPAAELIEALVDMADADVKAELGGWLAARPVEQAARELLDAAARSNPASRAVALTAVQDLGAAAEPAWREALAEPALRAYAAAQLPDAQSQLTRADADWMLIDVCAALLRFDAIEEMVAHLDELGGSAELASMMSDLGRVPHPDTVDVLTAIGDHHPDREVSKGARKAAFRSRSRLGPLG